MKKINKFISVHVPKTGGTIFRRHILLNNFELVKLDYQPNPLKDYSIVYNLKEYNVIHGHFRASKYADSNLPYIIWLRDPVARIISDYTFNVLKPRRRVDFDSYVDTQANVMSKYMDISLKRFVFVGILEKWIDSIKRFEMIVDKDLSEYYSPEFLESIATQYERDRRKYFNPSKKQMLRIRKVNWFDIGLYKKEREKYA